MYSTLVMTLCIIFYFFFFFKDTATTEIYTLSLHDALPISPGPAIEEKRHDHRAQSRLVGRRGGGRVSSHRADGLPGAHRSEEHTSELQSRENLVCRLLLEKKKQKNQSQTT